MFTPGRMMTVKTRVGIRGEDGFNLARRHAGVCGGFSAAASKPAVLDFCVARGPCVPTADRTHGVFRRSIEPPYQCVTCGLVHWLHCVGAGCSGPVHVRRACAPCTRTGARAQRSAHHGRECAVHHPHAQHQHQQDTHHACGGVAGGGHAGSAFLHHMGPCAELLAGELAGHFAVGGHRSGHCDLHVHPPPLGQAQRAHAALPCTDLGDQGAVRRSHPGVALDAGQHLCAAPERPAG